MAGAPAPAPRPGRLLPGDVHPPAELRDLAWRHQRTVYGLLLQCSWETLDTFSRNDPQLQGTAGAIAVLHTHSRRLDYHPHVHLAVPAAAVDARNRHRPPADLFKYECLDALARAAIAGLHRRRLREKAVYLGDHRGVIQEKDILTCQDGQVTFRYQDSKTRKPRTRTLSGAAFLWHLLRHVLPKGFRRTRNYGFLHPNRKRLIHLLQLLLKLRPGSIPARPRPALRCPCCGGTMKILHTRISPHEGYTRIQDVAAGYASFRTRVP